MVDTRHLCEIILLLNDHLSESDRERLHFFLGNNIPRGIRDNPSLGRTLNLIESLFDQDKISQQDLVQLINGFEEIHCFDAVRLLKEHMRQMQSSKGHESVQSLSTIMPHSIEGEDENNCTVRSPLFNQQYLPNNNIEMKGINNNQNINPVIEIVNNHSSQSKKKKPFKRSSTNQKYLFGLVFLLLLIAGLALLALVKFEKDFKMKEKIITEQKTENGGMKSQLTYHRSMINQTTRRFISELEKQNQTIEQLNNQSQQLFMELEEKNRTIQHLSDQLEQSQNEKSELNGTIRQLTDELHRCQDDKNAPIIPTTTTPAPCIPTPGHNSCGCPSLSICRENCISKFCATDGRCTGFINIACQCLIGDVWQFKSNQC